MLSGFEVGYDRSDHKLYEKHLHEAGKGELYRYDSMDRLIASSRGVPNPELRIGDLVPPAFSEHVAYAIDPVHNWSSRTNHRDPADLTQNESRSYAVNDLNQYSTVSESVDGGAPSETALIYDEAGNLIQDNLHTYTYDDRNLLTEVRSVGDSALVARYRYDALKRRISVERTDGTATQYIYDGWQVAQEIEDGIRTASYIYNDGIDEPVAMVRDGSTYFYHTDTRNNVSMMTNESGTVVERYEYDPYGSVTIKNAGGVELEKSTIGNNYLFSSRRYDSETGLHYYRHRTYSSELGRFLQRDPEEYVDSLNMYAYVVDDPVNSADPMGLMDPTAMRDQRDALGCGHGACSVDMTPNSYEEAMFQQGVGTALGVMIAMPAGAAVYAAGPYVGAELVGLGMSNLEFATDVGVGLVKGFMWGYDNQVAGMSPNAPHKALAQYVGKYVGIAFKEQIQKVKQYLADTYVATNIGDESSHPKK